MKRVLLFAWGLVTGAVLTRLLRRRRVLVAVAVITPRVYDADAAMRAQAQAALRSYRPVGLGRRIAVEYN